MQIYKNARCFVTLISSLIILLVATFPMLVAQSQCWTCYAYPCENGVYTVEGNCGGTGNYYLDCGCSDSCYGSGTYDCSSHYADCNSYNSCTHRYEGHVFQCFTCQ